MPGGGQPKRTVRIPDNVWAAFVTEAERAGVKPATVLSQFVRYYGHQPGAKMPRRPKSD